MNKISGLVISPAPAPAPAAVTDDDDDNDGLSGWGIIGMLVGVVAVFVMIYVLFRGSKEDTPTNVAQKDDSFDTDAQETYT
jgi:hypothetical protein